MNFYLPKKIPTKVFLTFVTPTWPWGQAGHVKKCVFADLLIWPSRTIIERRVSEILQCWQWKEKARRNSWNIRLCGCVGRVKRYSDFGICAGKVKKGLRLLALIEICGKTKSYIYNEKQEASIRLSASTLKGVLHPRLILWLFVHFTKKWQHIDDK